MTDVERVVEPIVKLFERIYREYEDDNSDVQIDLFLDETNGFYHVAHRNGDNEP